VNPFANVRITNESVRPESTRIELDGQDISTKVFRYELIGDACGGTVLRLDMHVGDIAVAGPMRAEVANEVAALLTALGWTPPAQLPVGEQF